jgi:antitoxin component YwqK of YwqJK toxin-antitoxin module
MKSPKTLVNLLSIVSVLSFNTARAQLFAKEVPCEKIVSEDNDRKLNMDIAKQCKNIWETKSGIGLLGPFGEYQRHVYVDDAVNKNELGVIVGKYVYVNAIIKQKSGKCKLAHVRFQREYEGGASYGRIYDGYVDGGSEPVDCACAEKLTDWLNGGKSENQQETVAGNNTKKSNSKGPKDGLYIENYSNGQAHITGAIKNGQPDGVWKEFYENGQVKVEGTMVNGVQEGMELNYGEDGKITSKTEYKNGKKNGKAQTLQNSVVTSMGTYADDKLEGEKNYYDNKGNKTKLETYKSDQLHGMYKEWNNGKLIVEGAYAEGAKDGVWKEYNAAGKVSEQSIWKEGIKQ